MLSLLCENNSVFPCQTCCCWTGDRGLLFGTTKGEVCFAAAALLSAQTFNWCVIKQVSNHLIPTFKRSQVGGWLDSLCLLWRFCRTTQAELLILAAWAIHLLLLVPRRHSSSFPPFCIKRLFVLPQWCLSLVSPPLLHPHSLFSGNERIF